MSTIKKFLEGSIYDTLFVAERARETSQRSNTNSGSVDPYDASQRKQISDSPDTQFDLTRAR